MRSLNSQLKVLTVATFFLFGLCAGAWAQELKQLKLTDKQVLSFIAAQPDFEPLSSKLFEGGEKPDAALLQKLETLAKKHSFADFAEYEDVGANISMVLDGLDTESGTYSEPLDRMKKELEEVKADDALSAKDKKIAIEDLTDDIAAAAPIKYKENIAVVQKHLPALEKLSPDDGDNP
jgi:lipase chaperone LimK